ncbi:hypothetical protein E2C01_041978 [Portunus trituberculatus]|uniref:Uncharacterized protein n=1 Tax=Portunus trituberculatus TaxID=210409 RepID=A0A5B7FKK6_PORTR|nr:hypothetical protein [Portunus trituberculatus]
MDCVFSLSLATPSNTRRGLQVCFPVRQGAIPGTRTDLFHCVIQHSRVPHQPTSAAPPRDMGLSAIALTPRQTMEGTCRPVSPTHKDTHNTKYR